MPVASPTTRATVVLLSGILLLTSPTAAQTTSTEEQLWPGVGLRHQFASPLSAELYSQLKAGVDYSYDQLGTGVRLGYQAGAFRKGHLINLNPDAEHTLVLGTGYEYLDTQQPSGDRFENRLFADGTIRNRPAKAWLFADRNRFEFRWINGVYSTRYRNRLTVQADLLAGGLHLSPYASAEFFYDWRKDAWNEEQYALGVLWQARRRVSLALFYLYQDCETCAPPYVNALGATITYFTGVERAR